MSRQIDVSRKRRQVAEFCPVVSYTCSTSPPSTTQPATTPNPAASNRKVRRVTIITIDSDSDSENAGDVPRLREPLAALPLSHATRNTCFPRAVPSSSKLNKTPSKHSPPTQPTQPIICLDSSDSEYDASAGVLKWYHLCSRIKIIG